MSAYIQDCNANNNSPGGVENVRRSPYTHAHVHSAVNGYRILDWGCDLPPGMVTWHLPRRGVQECRYKGYTRDPNNLVWSLYSVNIHDCNANNYSL